MALAQTRIGRPPENDPTRPLVSIVIPARDAAVTLPETLASVQRLQTSRMVELVVVDDGSRDATAELARRVGATVVENDGRGVAEARNTGARVARGDIVLFADSDVVLPSDAVDRVARRILDEGYDAVTGRLSAVNRYPDFASQYKNLWMAYTYEILPDDVSLFYTSAAAVRRSVFDELGGFSSGYRRPSVEDTAFGQVLGDRGYRVRSDKALAVEHLKAYRLRDVLSLDYRRARDLTRVFRQRLGRSLRRGNTSSVPTSFMGSVPLPFVALGAALWAVVAASPVAAALAAAALTLFWGANTGFLTYLLRKRGWGFFLASHLFLPLDALFVGAGIAAGLFGKAEESR